MKRSILLALIGGAALTASADYALNFPENTLQFATNPARYLSGVTFGSASLPEQYLNVSQNPGGDLYLDKTSQAIVLIAGQKVAIAVDWAGNWMNSYAYIDWGNNGEFNVEMGEDNMPIKPTDIISYSNYQGLNSAGDEAVNPATGQKGNTVYLPDFVAESKPGTYRFRVKIDYNNVDPGGNVVYVEGTDKIDDQKGVVYGGTIADATVVVIEPFSSVNQLNLVSEHGPLAATYNEVDGTVTISCTPDEGYFLDAVAVTHSIALPEGVALADAALGAPVSYSAAGGEVTIPAAALTAGATITAKFIDSAQMSGIWEYPSTMTGEKAANEGITALTVNDSMIGVNTIQRHYFLDRAFNVLVGQPLKLSCAYSGPATKFSLYVDAEQKGEFTTPIATAETPAKMGEVKLPASMTAGVYRARLLAEGDCEVDFLLNIYNSKISYRPYALNGLILDGAGKPMLETYNALQAISLTVKPALEGFATDTVIVRHGQNLNNSEYIQGNRQWADAVLPIDANGKVVIPAELVNGDVAVYALFGQQENSEWIKIWGDEFSGTTMDSKRWVTQGWRGSTWNRFCSMTPAGHKLVNVFDDGYYNSYCFKTPEDVKKAEQNVEMLSGAINSSGRFTMTYGRIEARAKTRKHTGNFPAFWMMPSGSTLPAFLNTWPNNGEIDIWESINAQDAVHTTIHSGWTYWRSNTYKNEAGKPVAWPAPKQNSPASTKQTGANMDLWHVFALEWDEEALRFYVDGALVFTYSNTHYYEPDSEFYLADVCWPFNKPFYVIVNQSVGNGSWAAGPDVNFDYLTQFDYVRAYQKKGGQYTNVSGNNGDDPNFYVPATNDPYKSAIEEVELRGEEFDGPAVYFDLSGRRVSGTPSAAGVYVRQQGASAQKIVIR